MASGQENSIKTGDPAPAWNEQPRVLINFSISSDGEETRVGSPLLAYLLSRLEYINGSSSSINDRFKSPITIQSESVNHS